jgi:hypothetical protein
MSEPTTFAKVEDGIVTDVRVVSYEFICANPDRYGDASLWIECFRDGSGRGYCSKGWTYDADLDEFVTPTIEESE